MSAVGDFFNGFLTTAPPRRVYIYQSRNGINYDDEIWIWSAIIGGGIVGGILVLTVIILSIKGCVSLFSDASHEHDVPIWATAFATQPSALKWSCCSYQSKCIHLENPLCSVTVQPGKETEVWTTMYSVWQVLSLKMWHRWSESGRRDSSPIPGNTW